MAIFHLETKVVSRGAGRSVVAAAAYASRSRLYNDYDGIEHNYSLVSDLVWSNVYLPPNAPPEWHDRATLWNAVEQEEAAKDSRLAREIILALPVELDEDEWKTLLEEYIRQFFVADGMCADVSIHNKDGRNPHAHLLLTVRPLDNNGRWQYKTQKEYLCVRDGIEQGFTADEYAIAKEQGWEKQYLFFIDGKRKEYMTIAEGQAAGYKRADKHPKSTKYGRQNPISAKWNSEEQLLAWREGWADVVNLHLAQHGLNERIDHRSFAERGIFQQPTIHEGFAARLMESKGVLSERCELNRMIRGDNAKLHNEQTAGIQTIIEKQEAIRADMIFLQYQQRYSMQQRNRIEAWLSEIEPDMNHYIAKNIQVRILREKIKTVQTEIDKCGILHPIRRNQLKEELAEVREKYEDANSERAFLLKRLKCADAKDVKRLESKIKSATEMRNRILSKQREWEDQFAKQMISYQAAACAVEASTTMPESEIRTKHMKRVRANLEETYSDKFDLGLFKKSVVNVDEDIRKESERQHRHDRNIEIQQQSMLPVKKNHDDAR